MAMTLISDENSALVIDASVAIAICAQEHRRDPLARAEINRYNDDNCLFYAPGILVAETLYILCQKVTAGELTEVEHVKAITEFQKLLAGTLPTPEGDFSLIQRAEQIRAGYGCSRSADGIYIALAEKLLQRHSAVEILTFDQNMPNQVAKNAPNVSVRLLTI